MAQQVKRLMSFMGFVTWGDIGPFTCYRKKSGQMVVYLKAPPLCPASPAQQVQRNRWRDAAAEWQLLDQATRDRWELASKRASLSVTGYNVWIYYRTTFDEPPIRTLERITGLQLL